MNTEQVKQVTEAIKTLNINVNSETGKRAIIAVADKVGLYLITKEVMGFLLWLTFFGVLFFLLKVVKNGINKEERVEKYKSAIGALELSETWDKQQYRRLTEEHENKS